MQYISSIQERAVRHARRQWEQSPYIRAAYHTYDHFWRERYARVYRFKNHSKSPGLTLRRFLSRWLNIITTKDSLCG
jgi:hypothetical protein